METLEAMIKLFRSATRIPVCWIYKKKILLVEDTPQRDPLHEIHKQVALSFPDKLSNYDKPKHLTTGLNEAYFALPANDGLLVFGPMLLHRPTEEELRYRLKKAMLPYGQLPLLRQYDYELAVTGDVQRYYIGYLAWNMFQKQLLTFESTIEAFPADRPEPMPDSMQNSNELKEFELEEKIMKAVRHGQTDMIRKNLHHYQQTDLNHTRSGLEMLRKEKNRLISSATLASRAAIQGGLSEEKAMKLKATYIRQAEKETLFDTVRKLHLTMILDFADHVSREQTGSYSSLVTRAIQLIEDNKTKNYLLSELAETLNLHPSYLSRLLKEETGMSFKRFLTHVRMETAKQMLQDPINSILEIALYLGYGGQSHFTQVFRSEIGMTPLQFRKQLIINHKKK
jgi:AraC-like DNA-binding protein